MKWTEARIDILATYAQTGVENIAQTILDETGGVATEAAIRAKAHALHISLKRIETCPMCGGAYRALHTDGLCTLCHVRYLTQLHIGKESVRPAQEELANAIRAYDRARKFSTKKQVEKKFAK